MSVKYLHNSNGKHVANFVNGQLHACNGRNIGHYLDNHNIFVDMDGRYLGEIVFNNRLVYKNNSPFKSINLGNYGNYGNVGNYGNAGNTGSIGLFAGYIDIPEEKLI